VWQSAILFSESTNLPNPNLCKNGQVSDSGEHLINKDVVILNEMTKHYLFLDSKAKRSFKWNDNTVVTSAAKEDEKDQIRVNSEDDSTLKAPESEGSQIEVNDINDVKLSKDEADPIETVSDLEKSDNGSNLIHKSDENEKERDRRISVSSSGGRRYSLGSSEGESTMSEKLSKLSMLKKIGVYASSSSLSREMSTDDEEGLYAPRPEVDFDVEDDEMESEKGVVALCVGKF